MGGGGGGLGCGCAGGVEWWVAGTEVRGYRGSV